jgi:N-sulfoglucosamine sulfohydrolase
MLKSADTMVLYPMFGLDEKGKHIPMTAFCDVDDGPSKRQMIEKYSDPQCKPFFDLAFDFRPEEELYDVGNDPFCLNNLADDPGYQKKKRELKNVLINELKRTGDPRITGENPEIFETYERFSPIRSFPEPSEDW